MAVQPAVSVIIATYSPGDRFDRVIASLDAQTLPQEDFEVLVVDDGSPDDTVKRMRALAATRPNMRVERIDNSGWPSRPRNVGTDLATGEYVLFMDHDDALFPDGLRRAVEFAREHGADLVSPKESRSHDPWWGLRALRHGNIGNVLPDGDIDLLRPMVPHKLYRREFLNEHGIRFPEGRRVLWEDNFQNVEVFRHARTVSVLADTPVYLWVSSEENSSRTYGPLSKEFWDRLDELTDFIAETLDGDDYAAARKSALMHEHRWRTLHRLTRAAVMHDDDPPALARAFTRARRIQKKHLPPAWDADLGAFDRLRAVLVRKNKVALLRQAYALEKQMSLAVHVTSMEWRGGVLHLELEARILENQRPLPLQPRNGRLLRVVPDEIAAAVPESMLDVTEESRDIELDIAVRNRLDPVSWLVPTRVELQQEEHSDGTVGLVARGSADLDLATAQVGAPLATGVWDFTATSRWAGVGRRASLTVDTARPAFVDGMPANAYRNRKGTLTLDTAQTLRSVVSDGGLPRNGGEPVGRRGEALLIPLPRLAVSGAGELAVELLARTAADAEPSVIPARVVAAEGAAHLKTTIVLPVGDYGLHVRLPGRSEEVVVPRRLSAGRDGVLVLRRTGQPAPTTPSLRTRVVRRLQRLINTRR